MKRLWLLMVLVLVAWVDASDARKLTTRVTTSDVVLSKASDGVCLVRVTAPEGVKDGRVDYAILEMKLAAVSENGLPLVLRVVPVSAYSKGAYTKVSGDWPGTMVRSSAAAQTIRLDITPVMRWLVTNGGTGYVVIERGDETADVDLALDTTGDVLVKIDVHSASR